MAQNVIDDLRSKMMEWGNRTLFNLRHNMRVQQVWPNLVYPRYDEVNAIRFKNGGWYSTGDSIETLRFVIKNSKLASEARMDFFFNEYLRYVDIGVGNGREVADVDRGRKARYKSRYARQWKPTRGHTHRPAFMMEFRHLQRTMAWYLMERYGYEGMGYVMGAFEGQLKNDK